MEDKRTMTMGMSVLDFRRRTGERIDDLLTRWDLARADAASAGADLTNFYIRNQIHHCHSSFAYHFSVLAKQQTLSFLSEVK